MAQPTVQFLHGESASTFMSCLLKEYEYFYNKYQKEDLQIFAVNKKDLNQIKELVKNTSPSDLVQQALAAVNGKVVCSPALKSAFVSQVLSMLSTYASYKINPSEEAFLSIYQGYADILSDISKLDIRSKNTVGFVLNVIVKNGFFEFLTPGSNSRIKVLRNIREHKNIISSPTLWNAYRMPIMPQLIEMFTRSELEEISSNIAKKYLMYDLNDKMNVTFILHEEPLTFLKKLITLAHIQLYMLGLNDKLILSQNLFDNYWSKKYDLSGCKLDTMPLEDLTAHLKSKQLTFHTTQCDI